MGMCLLNCCLETDLVCHPISWLLHSNASTCYIIMFLTFILIPGLGFVHNHFQSAFLHNKASVIQFPFCLSPRSTHHLQISVFFHVLNKEWLTDS
jgi:hypothetical protein